MFNVGNLVHDKVMASKQLFAKHVMPKLRHINEEIRGWKLDPAPQASSLQLQASSQFPSLSLYRDFNYVITGYASETLVEFVRSKDGKVTAGWDMRVPEREPDGFPYQIIFVGPTAGHRGSAIRLYLVNKDGGEISDAAEVLLETYHESGVDRQMIFQGTYRQFKEIPDQQAANAAVAVQQRTAAQDHYIVSLSVTVPEGAVQPDPAADESFFELECFKHVLNVTA